MTVNEYAHIVAEKLYGGNKTMEKTIADTTADIVELSDGYLVPIPKPWTKQKRWPDAIGSLVLAEYDIARLLKSFGHVVLIPIAETDACDKIRSWMVQPDDFTKPISENDCWAILDALKKARDVLEDKIMKFGRKLKKQGSIRIYSETTGEEIGQRRYRA